MTAHWPFFDLRVQVEDVELRFPDVELLEQLAEVADRGVHPEDQMPFLSTWSAEAPPKRGRSVIQWHWRNWAELAPDNWSLPFVSLRDGVVVGSQDMGARHFAATREVSTGSWLGLEHQGKGTGTLMRAAILALSFEGLGAQSAVSAAFEDNPSSISVSERVGYEPDGIQVHERKGSRIEAKRYRMTRERWLSLPRPDVRIEGLEPCLPLLMGEPT